MPSESWVLKSSSGLPHFTRVPGVVVEYIAKNQLTVFPFPFW